MDKRRIAITFLIVLIDAVAATAILPMLPIYVEGQFQATPLQAMLVIATFYAAQFVASPWLGRLSDRFGRRPLLIASQVGTILSYLLFIYAAPLGDLIGIPLGISGGLLMIYAARLLDGFTSGNVSVAEAYASDISDDRSRAHALGLIGGAVGLGHILGPALAVALSRVSLLAPMLAAATVSTLTLLLTILLLDEPPTSRPHFARQATRPTHSLRQMMANRPVALLLATAFIIAFYAATVFSSFSIYAERVLFTGQPAGVVIQNVNFIIMLLGLTVTISQIFLISPLVRHLGEQRIVFLGSVLLLGSAIGISTGSLLAVVSSILVYALGFAMSWPSLQAIMTRLASSESVGQQLGVVQSAFSLAFILAPLVAGFLLQIFGPYAIFYSSVLLLAPALLLSGAITRLPLPAATPGHGAAEEHMEPRGLLQRLHH